VDRVTRLRIVLGLNVVLIVALVVVGLTAHSLGVFAAGLDYLADAAAIVVSLVAISLSKREVTPSRPDGYGRATTYAAAVNAAWLVVLTTAVAAEAVRRLLTSVPEVHGLPVVVTSASAAAVMLLGAAILHADVGDDRDTLGDQLNMRAVLLDTAGDAAAAAGVAGAGVVILATGGWYWIDPTVALVVACVIAVHAIAILRQAAAHIRRPAAPNAADR
jgi:cobalt-zinc-cadmium efflux system protein